MCLAQVHGLLDVTQETSEPMMFLSVWIVMSHFASSDCFSMFHSEEDLTCKKAELKEKFEDDRSKLGRKPRPRRPKQQMLQCARRKDAVLTCEKV